MDIDIEDNGDGTFSIYYTAKDAGEYTINIKFGGQPVPDGVYSFTVSALKFFERVKNPARVAECVCLFGGGGV